MLSFLVYAALDYDLRDACPSLIDLFPGLRAEKELQDYNTNNNVSTQRVLTLKLPLVGRIRRSSILIARC